MPGFHIFILSAVLFFMSGAVVFPQRVRQSSGAFIFAPTDSRFAVSFPGRPKISGAAAAELNTSDFTMQVSYGAFRGVDLDDASLKAREMEINRNVGIPDALVTVRHTSLGIDIETKASYLGSPAESHLYVDSETGESILLYAAASKNTPKAKDAIRKFFDSISLNRNYVNTGYHFAPDNSEFEVTFPKKPSLIKEVDGDNLTDNGRQSATLITGTPAKGSKLSVGGGYSATTVQVFQTATDDELKTVALRQAQNVGLSSATVSVGRSKFGREVITRGYVTDEGIRMLFEKRTYIGSNSMIDIIVGAAANSFPTPDISTFLVSIKLRK